MKTYTIKTPTHEIMLVELPTADSGHLILNEKQELEIAPHRLTLSGDYKNLGFVADLTEEMCKPLVEESKTLSFENEDIKIYRDYLGRNYMCSADTALESFLSLLETKVMWENPKPELSKCRHIKGVCDDCLEDFAHANFIWKNRQSRTFDKARTIVLVKEK